MTVLRTNSGESIFDRWARNVDFHGAGGIVRWWVVVDMVRRRYWRRMAGLNTGAMVADGVQ